jgi:Ca2+-binding RTX toxin-like protein
MLRVHQPLKLADDPHFGGFPLTARIDYSIHTCDMVYCKSKPRSSFSLDRLERRTVLSATFPSVYEQYMVELINRARMNPQAEASLMGIELDEGLSEGAISTAPRQPLALNTRLVTAARGHAEWLRANNTFSHTGANNSTNQDRVVATGYALGTNWALAENLSLSLTQANITNYTERVELAHRELFIDAGVEGRGHRVNMFNGTMREIGSGIGQGAYTYESAAWKAFLTAQTFANVQGNAFLTGVAFTDRIRQDNFYTPGEGIDRVAVTAVNNATGARFSMFTWSSGGYSLRLPPGSYTVTASNTTLGGTVTHNNVTIGTENVKLDFTPAQAAAPTPWVVQSTNNAENITLNVEEGFYVIRYGDTLRQRLVQSATIVEIYALGGNDTITVGADVLAGVFIDGGDGNDSIFGGTGADTLQGGAGNDYIWGGDGRDLIFGGIGLDTLSGGAQNDVVHGGEGDDRINGNGSHDQLFGGEGDDRIYGGAGEDAIDVGSGRNRAWGEDGNDLVVGGNSSDRIWGGRGNDTLMGRGGDDFLFGGEGNDILLGALGADLLDGDIGIDSGDDDELDTLISIEIIT